MQIPGQERAASVVGTLRRTIAVLLVSSIAWSAEQACAQEKSSTVAQLMEKTYAAQVLLDECYGCREDLLKAQQAIEDVLSKRSDFVPAYVQAARATIMGGYIVSRYFSGGALHQFSGGTLERAEAILLRARGLDATHADVHVLLGHVYYLKDDVESALRSLDRARELHSKSPWLYNNYGDVYQRVDELEDAAARYQIVINMGVGTTPQGRRAYVHALWKMQWLAALREDNDAVVRYGRLATSAAPVNDAWVWGNVGNVLFVQGYFDDAITHARKALSIMNYGHGREVLALGLYGKWATLTANGRGAEAEEYFVEAYSLQPDLDDVVSRFRTSAKPVKDLIPIVSARRAKMPRQVVVRP